MLYDRIKTEYVYVQNQITKLKKQLKDLPDGKLVCAKNGGYYKWYIQNGSEMRYLPKTEQQLARKLALKKYYSLQLEDLQHERTALQMYLRHHQVKYDRASELLANHSEYCSLLSAYYSNSSKDLQTWAHQPYEKNQNHPEQLIHKCSSGHIVRSKSEALIDLALYQHQIPYRYESPLTLNNITIYPDFTLRHPQTGFFLYWEHFGMMDNTNYAKNAFQKLQLYNDNGLYPSIHVITTYETSDTPLTTETIEAIIHLYFN